MSFFVRSELDQFVYQRSRSKAHHENLTTVNVDRTLFDGVIHFHDPVAKFLGAEGLCSQFHDKSIRATG